MFRKFTQHPASVGESYGGHFVKAAVFGVQMIAAGLACMVHAALPFLFQRTGSEVIAKLNQALEQRRPCSAENGKKSLDGTQSTQEPAAPGIG